jgi:hypothetical protein
MKYKLIVRVHDYIKLRQYKIMNNLLKLGETMEEITEVLRICVVQGIRAISEC